MMTKLKCINNLDSEYLTQGKVYEARHPFDDESIEIIDDEGGKLFQCYLSGLHGVFEVVNE